jgi:fatty acid desaturase
MGDQVDTRKTYGSMNLCVAVAQVAGWAALISALHLPIHAAWKVLALITFCLMMQGVFSLMHECFHGLGHPRPALNRAIGIAASTIFGTAYTLYRVNHEGHHLRNRSRAEVAEYIYPGESTARKTFLYYFAILGGIWLGSLVATLVLPFIPYRYSRALNRPAESMNGYSLSFDEFTAADWRWLRIEALIGVVTWVGVSLALGWRWQVLLVTYAAFAFSWSSLQWVYHMRTPLDRIEGAYDLRAPLLVRWLFLNFNYNLTHHREPYLPWQSVHAVVNPRETQPLWYRYLLVFKAPERMPEDPSSIVKTYF